jgi:hypothetical protein
MADVTPTATPSPRVDFVDFVAKFPPIAMPVTLGEDTHHTFGVENEPLTQAMIEQFIGLTEPALDDEFTEYIPCFGIDCDEQYIALVWWKAGLLRYEYILATFTEKGQLIAHRPIAYTEVMGQDIKRAVATIDQELTIHVAEGMGHQDAFDPATSRTSQLDILPDGRIGR